ncbi:MAG: dienelactone hydrolase family protein [Gammaproteobacteria bacterium]|nr:dienelactone hydrolase family protein [Gammaproteobacteria bacterium]
MAKATLVLAHGAGANSNSEFMVQMSSLIGNQDIKVLRFDFPYMQGRQATGKKSPPDRMPKLEAAFLEQLETLPQKNLFIGGKSMGGRVATMIAEQVKPSGVICFGYPFHPPGKPEKTRTEHLKTLQTPTLIIQGSRDTFGKPEEVASYDLSSKIQVKWLDDGNHSLETLKRSAITTEQAWQLAATHARDFITALSK